MKYTRKFLFCVQIAQIPFVFVQNKGIFARYVPFQPRKAPLPRSVKIVTKRKQFPYKVLYGYYLALQLLRCGAVAERVPVKDAHCALAAVFVSVLENLFFYTLIRVISLFHIAVPVSSPGSGSVLAAKRGETFPRPAAVFHFCTTHLFL